MKSTGIPQVTALLAALALTLPACTQDTESDGSSQESVASEASELERAGSADRHQGKLEAMKKRFAEADSNGDGQLTRQEHEASVAARFAKVDVDSDGELSEAELDAMKEAHRAKRTGKGKRGDKADRAGKRKGKRGDKADRAGKRMGDGERAGKGKRMGGGDGPGKMRGPKRMDADGNGTVSLEEFSQHHLGWFERADADGNDTVTLQEMESAGKAMHSKRGKRGKHGKHGKRDKRGGMKHLQEADENGDGQITKAEAQAHRSAKFDELDADGNGMLSPEERPAKRGKRGKRGQGAQGERGEQRAHKGMGRMDQDEDGLVSKAEFLAGTDRMFERLDENGDEVISAEELSSHSKMDRKGRRGSARVGR